MTETVSQSTNNMRLQKAVFVLVAILSYGLSDGQTQACMKTSAHRLEKFKMTQARESESRAESSRLSEGDRNGQMLHTDGRHTRKEGLCHCGPVSMNEHKVSYDHCTPGC